MHHFSLQVREDIKLVYPTLEHAEEIFEAMDQNRHHLSQYLDWIEGMETVEDETNFLQLTLEKQARGEAALFLIYKGAQFIGMIDLHQFNKEGHFAGVGYWLIESHTGNNIMTDVLNKVCDIAFNQLKLNKLKLKAEVDNIASNKVALKAGFQLVGTFSQEIFRPKYDTYVDINEYELLQSQRSVL